MVRRWKTAVLMAALVFTGGFLLFALPMWSGFQDQKVLRATAVEADGIIVRTCPDNHDTCEYTFSAEGHTHSGRGTGCGKAQVGSEVDVWYARNDPDNSANAEPRNLMFPWPLMIWVLIIMPGAAALGILYSRKAGQNGQSPKN